MKTNRTKRYDRSLLSCALAACLAMSVPALAQSTSATLRGQVAAGSKITVTNIDTGLSRSAQANADGSYTIPGLPPGTYRVEGGAGGARNITLAVGQVATVNLGQAAAPADGVTNLDTVQVVAEFVPETKTSEVATYVSSKQIEMLPQNSRNFLAFADTVPGMMFESNGANGEARLRSGAGSANNINVFIDGVGQKNYVTPGGITGQDDSSGNPFPQSAIGEYKVITSNYKAEYDQISSAAVTAVTRSGTNEFQGSVFWDQTSEAWRKPTPQEEVTGVKSESQTKQFGGWVSGAIVKDRLHYFLSYEGKDNVVPAVILAPNNVNVAALPSVVTSEYGDYSRPFKQDLYFGKLSWQVSDDHLIEFSARYRSEVNELDIGNQVAVSAGTGLNNNETRYDLRSLYSGANWLNDAHITFEKAAYNPRPLTPEASKRYTIRNQTNTGDVTVLNTGGGGNFQDKGQKGFALQDDFTWYGWESHTIKVGFKYKAIDLTAFQQFPPFPRYIFDVGQSLTQPWRIEYTAPRSGRDPFVSSSNKQFGFYVQDDWEVNDKLTLNIGVRWDYEDNPSYTDSKPAAAIVAALRGWANIKNTDYNVEDYISDGSNRKNFKGAWQPRLGFSYDLNGDQRHVFFGGAGRAYDRNLFDLLAREFYGGAFTTYQINFSMPNHTCAPSASCIPFNPALMTEAGLAAYAAANPLAGGEVQLMNNRLKTPYSDQFSLGMRNTLEVMGHDWNTSVSLAHIRSRDGIYFHLGNRRPDGSFHEFESLGQTWGNAPFGFAIPGYGSLILADNGFDSNQTMFLVSADKPYTEASPWGVNVAYTFTNGKENRPNVASTGESALFDYPFADDRYYRTTGVPKHRLVLSGIYSPGWDLTFSSKLILQSQKLKDGVNCLNSPLPPAPNYRCQYDTYKPEGSVGFKQFDLAVEKRFEFGGDYAFKIRADVLNVFNWRNWNSFSNAFGTGPNGRAPMNPNLGVRNGNGIDGQPRFFKLSMGFDW